jgi:alpha-L-fucosidase
VKYLGTWKSVSAHPVPQWYEDAKLGVFLHWGLYSVPAWAPRSPDITALLRQQRPSWLLRNMPYAEWYANTSQLPGSPTQLYHQETFGSGFPYDGFRPDFEGSSSEADLEEVAALCRDAGARYVVLTAKHCDGYRLWPATQPHPVKGPYHPPRDLVGDMTRAVTRQGMRMGLYYSGGYDWPYNGAVLATLGDLLLGGPAGADYARYAESQVLELIERYRPSVLWNDVGWPSESHLPSLLAAYYNEVEDGVVNDRWFQGRRSPLLDRVVRGCAAVVEGAWPLLPSSAKRVTMPSGRHADFATLEYVTSDRRRPDKWEATRGVGHSFGANRNEAPNEMPSGDELVRLFVDVVAKNGNLLIGVGPMADGRIPDWQAERLRALGRWLEINGEAIFGTRPWTTSSATASNGAPVRFTTGPDVLYATVVGTAPTTSVTLGGFRVLPSDSGPDHEGGESSDLEIRALGSPRTRCAVDADGRVVLDFGSSTPASPAHVVRIRPRWRCRVVD